VRWRPKLRKCSGAKVHTRSMAWRWVDVVCGLVVLVLGLAATIAYVLVYVAAYLS
jgi:SPW repeat